MSVLSILALPLTLLEYYFTKERVTLEAQNSEEPSVPFAKQLKAIFTDKYMLIIYAYFLIFTFGASIKNLSLVYFCNYVLGTYNDGITPDHALRHRRHSHGNRRFCRLAAG